MPAERAASSRAASAPALRSRMAWRARGASDTTKRRSHHCVSPGRTVTIGMGCRPGSRCTMTARPLMPTTTSPERRPPPSARCRQLLDQGLHLHELRRGVLARRTQTAPARRSGPGSPPAAAPSPNARCAHSPVIERQDTPLCSRDGHLQRFATSRQPAAPPAPAPPPSGRSRPASRTLGAIARARTPHSHCWILAPARPGRCQRRNQPCLGNPEQRPHDRQLAVHHPPHRGPCPPTHRARCPAPAA